MTTLLQYRLDSGLIKGIWRGTPPELLLAQVVAADPVYGYLLDDGADSIPPDLLQTQYEVTEGVRRAKTEVTLTADTLTFAADGVTVCTLSVVPFVACQLVLNGGSPVVLSEGDPALELTSDVPEVFTVTLVPMASAWAEPLTVEAV